MAQTFDLNAERQFPMWGLPPTVRRVAECVSTARQAPIDFVVAPMLVAMGAAIGNKAIVRADYDNQLNLFVGVVGNSATNKSVPATDIFKPLREIHADMRAKYEGERDLYDMAVSGARSKKGAVADLPKPPIARQIFLGDSTPEARIEAYRNNPERLIWFRDELKALFDDFGRYTTSGEATELLSIYDGNAIDKNRKTDGVTYVDKPWLSVFGTTQPKALWATFGNTIYLDSGLVPRFMWFYPRELPRRDFNKSESPDSQVMGAWRDFIGDMMGADIADPITLTDEARQIVNDFRNESGNGKEDYDATVWGKLHKAVFKLSGIAAIARWIDKPLDIDLEVSASDMSWAVDCAYYLHRTAIDIEGLCRQDPCRQRANRGEAIRQLISAYPDCNKSALAEALGISRQRIYESLK